MAKKKPEPQLYESIQPKTFFDINGKTKIKTNKKYRISNFEIKEKEKSRVSSIPNQFTRKFQPITDKKSIKKLTN
jgi:hypothetical protein